jgi:hypothetical protein
MALNLDERVEKLIALNSEIKSLEEAAVQLKRLKLERVKAEVGIGRDLHAGNKISNHIVDFCLANFAIAPLVIDEFNGGEYISALAWVPIIEDFLMVIDYFKGNKIACYKETRGCHRGEDYSLVKRGIIMGKLNFDNEHRMNVPLEGHGGSLPVDAKFFRNALPERFRRYSLDEIKRNEGVAYRVETCSHPEDKEVMCLYIGRKFVDAAVVDYDTKGKRSNRAIHIHGIPRRPLISSVPRD